MIDRSEIEAKAKEFEIHVTNVERDYVFGWLLSAIYSTSSLRDVLILKGGNCFRKAYFESSRYSGDLDFATEVRVGEDLLLEEFNQVCDLITELSGVEFHGERNRIIRKDLADKSKEAYLVQLYFRDFYGKPEKITISVKIDIVELERIHLPVQTRNLIHPYSDGSECSTEIRCIKLEEALAEKLKCLIQRVHIVDLYDFVYSVFINQDIEVDRQEIASTFLRKTIFERAPWVAAQTLLRAPLDRLDSFWKKHVICPVQSALVFDVALDRFRKTVNEIFSFFGRSTMEFNFYPPELRFPIMEAGRDQKLLQITYDGVVRTVEPYSLSFKVRQDGVGHEYFYAYDRTGGRHSGPSIKSFFHTKVERLVQLDEGFEPRVEVELSKSGESIGRGYFKKPTLSPRKRRKVGKKARRPRRQPNTSYHGIIYVIQCTYCARRFERKKLDTRMRTHNDKFGNDCVGRTGFLVNQKYR